MKKFSFVLICFYLLLFTGLIGSNQFYLLGLFAIFPACIAEIVNTEFGPASTTIITKSLLTHTFSLCNNCRGFRYNYWFFFLKMNHPKWRWALRVFGLQTSNLYYCKGQLFDMDYLGCIVLKILHWSITATAKTDVAMSL